MKIWLQLKDNRVGSWSEGEIKTQDDQERVDITKSELDMLLSNNYEVQYKANKLKFIKGKRIIMKEQLEADKQIIQKVRSGTVTNNELADFLRRLIT